MKKTIILIILGVLLSGSAKSQWQRMPLPDGGNINSLAFLQGVVYASSEVAGVYSSEDYGQNWGEANNGLSCLLVYSLYTYGNRIYAATQDGIYYKTNQTNWTKVSGNIAGGFYRADFQSKGDTLYVNGHNGVYMSTDSGLVWTSISQGAITEETWALFVKDSLILASSFYQAKNYIYRSANNGQTWTKITVDSTVWPVVMDIKMHNQVLYCGTSHGGIYKSTDFGLTWVGIPSTVIYNVFALEFVGNNLFAGDHFNGIFKSTNYSTFSQVLSTGKDIERINTFVKADSVLIAASSFNGIYRSLDNGNTWTKSNNGIPTIVDYFQVTDSAIYIDAGGNGLWRSTNMGMNWCKLDTNIQIREISTFFCEKDSMVYACTDYGVIYVSHNNGMSWCDSVLLNYMKRGPILNIFRVDSFLIASVTNDGVYRSSDYGHSWTPVNIGWDYTNVVKLVHSNNRLLALTYGSSLTLYKSDDFGLNWSFANFPQTTALNINIYAKGNIIYVSKDTSMYCSYDSGNTWVVKSLPSGDYVFSIDFENQLCIIGIWDDFYYSNDSCQNWHSIHDSINLTDYEYVKEIQMNNSIAYVNTRAKGIYTNSISSINGIPKTREEFDFALFPNPVKDNLYFRCNTEIDIIRIYSVDGKQILQKSVNDNHGMLDVSKLIRGIYFIRMTNKSGHHSSKFIKL